MVQITAIHMVGGARHEHISDVKWTNPADKTSGESSRAQMVEWIDGGGVAYVTDGSSRAYVGVVNASPKYIRTYADKVWTDNLLALPRY